MGDVLLPTCDIDEVVFFDNIDCGNIEATGDVAMNAKNIETTCTQEQRDNFLLSLGIDPKEFFEDD